MTSKEQKQSRRAARQRKAMEKKPETEKEKKRRLAINKAQFMNRLITKPKKKFKYVSSKKVNKDGKVITVRKKVKVKNPVTKIKRIDW